MPGEERQLPGVCGLVQAEHDEAEARVVSLLLEGGPQTLRPVGRYGDVSPWRATRWLCFPSGPFDILPAEQLFEGPSGLAEQVRAAETRVRSR